MTDDLPGAGAPLPVGGRAPASSALRHPDYRSYFFTSMLTMMGDNIEHVITYWIIFDRFDSPALGGFAVISHWVPYLLFSVYFGTLADRYDCRRIIRLAQFTFASASLGWGVLYWTDTLEPWHAIVLLVVHGFSGAVQTPANQLIIHDIVPESQLQSGVRLGATSTQLGFLIGPAVGAGLLIVFGPSLGLLLNCLCYAPRLIWTLKVPYTGHAHRRGVAPGRVSLGFGDIWRLIRELSGSRTIMAMVALAGATSFFVGNGYQPQLPEFVQDLGYNDGGVAYGALSAAASAGAVAGGLILDGTGWLKTKTSVATGCAMLWTVTIIGFALAPTYSVAFVLLVLSGGLQLAFSSMAQAIVQLEAPPHLRGRAIGLFSMSFAGLRVGSGFTIGIMGGVIGIHWSLGLSAVALLAVVMVLFIATLAAPRERVLTKV